MPSDSDTDEVSSPSSPAPQEPLRLLRARAKSVRLDVAPDVGIAAASPARSAHSREAQHGRSMSASFSRPTSRPTSAASSRSASRTTTRQLHAVRARPRQYSATFGRRRMKRKSSEASRARAPSAATSGRTSPDEQQDPAEGQDGAGVRRSLTRRFDGHRDMGMVRAIYREAKRSFQLMRDAAGKEAVLPEDERGSTVPATATATETTLPLPARRSGDTVSTSPAPETPSPRRNLAAAAWKVVASQGARPRATTQDTELDSARPSFTRVSFNSNVASEPASPARHSKVQLAPAMVSRLGMKAMVKAVRTMNYAMLLIEESQHKVAQRKAMENMETKSLIQAGDWQSIEGILKQTAEDVVEKADDPDDASCVRLREALNEAAARAQKLSVLQGSVGDLAPLIQAIPDALAKIKSQIRMKSAATAQAQQSAADGGGGGGGGGTLASEPKEVKRMLAAVLEAENLLEKTRSMRGNIESSVRSLNEGLGELGCLPPPTCVMGHAMTWRPVGVEGKVFCDRCSVPRYVRDGIAPSMWRCDECARENRKFHFCKECGDHLQDELVIQKCAPADWEQIMKIADEALASTHSQLAACPATGTASAGGHSMADMLQDLRREVNEVRHGRRRSVRRRSSVGRPEEEGTEHEAFARRLSRRLSRSSVEGEEQQMSRRASSARRASSMGSTAAKHPEEPEEDEAAAPTGDEEGQEEEGGRSSSKGTASASLTDDSGSSDSEASSSTASSSEDSSSEDGLDKSGPGGDGSHGTLQSSRANLMMGFSGIANLKVSARRLLHYANSGKGRVEGGFASVVSAMAAERGEALSREHSEAANLAPPSSARTPRRPLLPSRRPPGTASSSLGSAKLHLLLRRPKPSQAEMQLEQLRREVLALGPPERILTPEPLPQPDFSSGSPSSVLSAAIAISGSPLDEQPLPTKLLLPPLKPIKAYVPATTAAIGGSANLEEFQQPGHDFEEAGCLATARGGLSTQRQRATPRSESLGWKGSRLGSAGSGSPPSSRQSQAHTLLQNSTSSRASTAREAARAQDGPRRFRWNTPGMSTGGVSSRDDLVSCKTVAFSGGYKVRGRDPMAGSLFAREAVLDTFSKERGIYQGQLHQRYAAAAPALELTAW